MRPEEVRYMEIEMPVYGEGAPDRVISLVFTIEAKKRYVLKCEHNSGHVGYTHF